MNARAFKHELAALAVANHLDHEAGWVEECGYKHVAITASEAKVLANMVRDIYCYLNSQRRTENE